MTMFKVSRCDLYWSINKLGESWVLHEPYLSVCLFDSRTFHTFCRKKNKTKNAFLVKSKFKTWIMNNPWWPQQKLAVRWNSEPQTGTYLFQLPKYACTLPLVVSKSVFTTLSSLNSSWPLFVVVNVCVCTKISISLYVIEWNGNSWVPEWAAV